MDGTGGPGLGADEVRAAGRRTGVILCPSTLTAVLRALLLDRRERSSAWPDPSLEADFQGDIVDEA